jgi:hypothetical protein
MTWPFSISDALVLAYQKGLYDVELAGALRTFRVGEPCALSSDVSGARVTVVSACNPFSVLLSAETNNNRHRMLVQEIASRDLCAWPATGRDRDDCWPAETSLAVGGSTTRLDDLLMVLFGQNAVLVLTVDGPAKLRWHPASDRGAAQDGEAFERSVSTLDDERRAGKPSPALELHAPQWQTWARSANGTPPAH